MSSNVANPVLTGFNPDPSILRVGSIFYIATSTFEWFPGVQIHRSEDLANWRLAARPVGKEHIQMLGNPPSGGIWAPCLSWDGELFHLIFTDVKQWANPWPFKDQLNYLTTAPSIEGPWSPPVYLNSSGFDGSLFHDDGRKWFVNMEWDHRQPGKERFAGILLQEYDPQAQSLIGREKRIFPGSELGLTEAPHLYKRGDWYYLMTAEGGTAYNHAVTIARSRSIEGPYELPEHHPMLTAKDSSARLQKAGHGSLVDDPYGNWYLAHLCGRPLQGTDRCILGRETAIQNVDWIDDWPVISGGGNEPLNDFTVPWPVEKGGKEDKSYRFDGPDLPMDFQTLRIPCDPSVYSFQNGALVMRGRESILSRHSQSLVARRQKDFAFLAETELKFEPRSFQEMAGLSYRYDEQHQYYLYLSHDENLQGPALTLVGALGNRYECLAGPVDVSPGILSLRVEVDDAEARFSFKDQSEDWTRIGATVDASILSDDYVQPLGFTGAFVGMACQDLRNRRAEATFLSFRYQAK